MPALSSNGTRRRNERVVRKDQGGDTVSEGQGYELLLAVAIRERQQFAAAGAGSGPISNTLTACSATTGARGRW